MKRITMALMLFFGVLTIGVAQTTATPVQTTKDATAAQKKADKEAKKLEKKQEHDAMEAQKKADKDAKVAQSTGLNKNGTPDKRLKANKQPKVQAQTQTPVQPQTPATVRTQATQSKTQVTHAPSNTTDKVVSTDAKGRTIYEGPRGGHYYIDKNGNKEYIKK